MTGATLFSGVATAELAAPEIEWLWCAENDRDASAVIGHRFPGHPNLGDVTAPDFPELVSAYGPVDVLVFGSPCQSFSVAGKRLGLDDPRGNLALLALGIVARLRPSWFVFENVPGLFSSWSDSEEPGIEESDFASWLQAVEECGYHVAWSVLDAQHFGVPQRRRRIFAVGHSGDWRYPAAVLFEPEGVPRHHKARREKRERSPRPANASARLRRFWESLVNAFDEGAEGALARGADPQSLDFRQHTVTGGVTSTLQAKSNGGGGYSLNYQPGVLEPLAFGGGNCGGDIGVATCLTHHGTRQDFDTETFIAHTLSAEGVDASEDGNGRGTPLVAEIFPTLLSSGAGDASAGNDYAGEHEQYIPVLADPVSAHEGSTYTHEGKNNFRLRNCVHAVAFNLRGRENGSQPEIDPDGLAGMRAASGGSSRSYVAQWAVRRLTPRETERLQGLPDDFTLVPSGRGGMMADGPRYRMVGNGMALPVVKWILSRLQQVERAGAEREDAYGLPA